MRDDPPGSDARPGSVPAATPLTVPEIDEILAGLTRSSTDLVREWQAEQRRAEELNERSESEIMERAEGQGHSYGAESVALSVHLRLANSRAKESHDAARKFVCWWADAAVTAWTAVVHERQVTRARLGAAAPETLLADEDMAVLPAVDAHTRGLGVRSVSRRCSNGFCQRR
ncbi:hypothetical protein [Streptomyces phytohabitans]|uniref:hypothetical protein n=1 Tax=Streptomyces phytohabitans TaxID=1150371 RepID=UPI00345C1C70